MLARGSGSIIGLFLCCFLIAVVLRIIFGWIFIIIVIILLVVLIFLLSFFRDPQRKISEGIVAAADGIIKRIDQADEYTRIVTFMNIHNVHVNRVPISGKVKKIERSEGGYIPAYDKKADNNKKLTITLETDIGEVKITQIVGYLARRIVPYVKEGQYLSKGQRIGMIRFGSRVDVFLPSNRIEIKVKLGEKVRAGETTVAEVNV